jgi:DNA repair protein RecO (recombination protein O)
MSTKERSLRVEGVVLKHINWGETDRLVTIFTRELGKVRVVAKGIRKPRSRKAGHLEPFTRSKLQLARGRDLFILTQAEAIETHFEIKNDLVKLGYASYIIELLTSFTYEEEDNWNLYRLLVNTLSRLEKGGDPILIVRYYEIRLLDLVGYRPKLFTCANCETEILAEDQFFSAAQGGVLCPKCGSRSPSARPISTHALRYLRHFQRSSYQDAIRAQINPSINSEMEKLMLYYLTYILEKGLKTPTFLNRMLHERSISLKDKTFLPE